MTLDRRIFLACVAYFTRHAISLYTGGSSSLPGDIPIRLFCAHGFTHYPPISPDTQVAVPSAIAGLQPHLGSHTGRGQLVSVWLVDGPTGRDCCLVDVRVYRHHQQTIPVGQTTTFYHCPVHYCYIANDTFTRAPLSTPTLNRTPLRDCSDSLPLPTYTRQPATGGAPARHSDTPPAVYHTTAGLPPTVR